MRTVERLVDRIWKLGFEADFEDEQVLQDKAVRFNFCALGPYRLWGWNGVL